MRRSLSLVAAALLAVSLSASAEEPAKKAADGTLTDAKGMTLYIFDLDSGGKSVCSGGCAASWPPLLAGADAKASGDWSLVTREDGSKQWAYKGKPLYRWLRDAKPGDKTGDGLNGVWHVAK